MPLETPQPSPQDLTLLHDFVHLTQMYGGSRIISTADALGHSRLPGSKLIWRPNGLDCCVVLGGDL